MINSSGWFEWADRMPGSPQKTWPETNSIEACVFHSAVGSLQGVVDVVLGPPSNQRSVTGVIGYNGRFIQFYSVKASPWANGNHEYNRRFLGFEFEGGVDTPSTVSEPLTPEQISTAVWILSDLAEYKRVPLSYWQRPWSLKEHKELIATACPSGRILWDEILRQLQEEAQVYTPQQRVDALVKAIIQINNGWNLSDLGPEIAAILKEITQEATGDVG